MTKPGNLAANPVSIVWDGMDSADTSNGTIAVLTFTAPDAAGTYPVSVSYQSGAIVDGDLHSVAPTVQKGSVTVAAVATRIKNISVSGKTVTAEVFCAADDEADIVCASYDNSGKLIGTEIKTVNSGADNSIVIDISGGNAAKVRFFVLDKNSDTPLCKSGEAAVN